jgi:PAS domain S-box-containing protein
VLEGRTRRVPVDTFFLFYYNPRMTVFGFFHFFFFVAYTYLAVYIFIKNPKALVNRVCSLFFLCFALWSFTNIYMYTPHLPKDIVRLSVSIGSLGWISFSSFFLWFTLAFTGKQNVLKKKWIYLILFGVPLFFIYKQWTNDIFVDYVKEWFGWGGVYGPTLWPYLFFLYYLLFMGIAYYILVDFRRKTWDRNLKKQAKIISVTMGIALVLGSFTDVISVLIGIYAVPRIANAFLLIWALGVVYATKKYSFLTITPVTAADKILSTMFECLVLLDLKGEITAVNRAAVDVLGYTEKELKGMPVDRLFPVDKNNSAGSLPVLLREAAQAGLKNEEVVLKAKDGKNVYALFSSSVLKDEAGNAAGLVCVIKDISEKKRLGEELFKSKKLEAIGMLAGGIAEDFNLLFSSISWNIRNAKEKLSGDEAAGQFLVKAEKALLKAFDLSGKFSALSPSGEMKRERIALSYLMEKIESWGLPGSDFRPSVSYDIDMPAHLFPVYGEKRLLIQVIQNLFMNAVEAVPDGKEGFVTVRGENVKIYESDKEHQTPLKKGTYVKITVRDHGIGIPHENIERVFDPYFSTKTTVYQKGLGLGLTICYAIIKKHGGHITVESEEGKGTLVSIYLPVQ